MLFGLIHFPFYSDLEGLGSRKYGEHCLDSGSDQGSGRNRDYGAPYTQTFKHYAMLVVFLMATSFCSLINAPDGV